MLYKMQMANKKKVVFKKTTLSKRVLTNTSILLIRGQIFLEVIIVLVMLVKGPFLFGIHTEIYTDKVI